MFGGRIGQFFWGSHQQIFLGDFTNWDRTSHYIPGQGRQEIKWRIEDRDDDIGKNERFWEN